MGGVPSTFTLYRAIAVIEEGRGNSEWVGPWERYVEAAVRKATRWAERGEVTASYVETAEASYGAPIMIDKEQK